MTAEHAEVLNPLKVKKSSQSQQLRLLQKHVSNSKPMKSRVCVRNCQTRVPSALNLLDRQFDMAQPDRVWVGDSTCVATNEGALFYSDRANQYAAGKTQQNLTALDAGLRKPDAVHVRLTRRIVQTSQFAGQL